MFVLLSIARTAIWIKNLLAQSGLLDATTGSYSPNPTTIFPAQAEIVASVSRLFTMAISLQAILFVASLSLAIWLGSLGFTRLVQAYEARNSGWPEEF